MKPPSHVSSKVLLLADNLALDFVNSEYGVGDQHHDCLTDDESVVSWLIRAGQLAPDFNEQAPQGLINAARELRQYVRAVIYAAMAKAPADLGVVNDILEKGHQQRRLEWDEDSQTYNIVTRRRHCDSASLLEPVAGSLASLLTSEKFEFVRQCEAHDCVLLFHDLTKSHRRRWCSMATCGNRMKVAAFRSRQKE